MDVLLLGRGKTGSLVAEVARQRGHEVQIAGSKQNEACAALTSDKLQSIDIVIDFTTAHVVPAHIEACVKAEKNMVVGTTGWYAELDRVRKMIEQHNMGFLYAANFSIGVNLFLEIARASAPALQHGYMGQIFERHHAHKKDAPSGTAMAIQRAVSEAVPPTEHGHTTKSSVEHPELEIISFREGEVVGMHELVYESSADRIYLCHDAKSRQGFAEGAVRAAEWLQGKKGFYDFEEVWPQV
jgi:4-hydroxy-tetrahydrodipicolinate reductase